MPVPRRNFCAGSGVRVSVAFCAQYAPSKPFQDTALPRSWSLGFLDSTLTMSLLSPDVPQKTRQLQRPHTWKR